MSKYNIMTILINHRTNSAKLVQQVLTEHGCHIKVRLGLHETSSKCAEDGLIILQLDDEDNQLRSLEKALNALDGVKTTLLILKSD